MIIRPYLQIQIYNLSGIDCFSIQRCRLTLEINGDPPSALLAHVKLIEGGTQLGLASKSCSSELGHMVIIH